MQPTDIGWAVRKLKDGERVTRPGWNGKGMWLALRPAGLPIIPGSEPTRDSEMTLPYIYMRTAQGGLVPWLASQTDVLSEDWMLVEP